MNKNEDKKNNIIELEILKKQFDEIPSLLTKILELDIKNECIIDLYEFIELSIIYDKFYKKNKKDKEFQSIILEDETVSILRKFYIRFIFSNDNEINKELLLSESILENKDLFFTSSPKNNNKLDKIKENILNNLNKYTIKDCIKIYLNKISQDKELEEYDNIDKNKKENGMNFSGAGSRMRKKKIN